MKDGFMLHHCPPLIQGLLIGYKVLWLQLYSPYLQMCGLNFCTDKIYASLLTVPALIIFKMLSVCHKKSMICLAFISVALTSWAKILMFLHCVRKQISFISMINIYSSVTRSVLKSGKIMWMSVRLPEYVTSIKLVPVVIIFNPLNAELNPICHMLALLWAHHILHVSRIRVK